MKFDGAFLVNKPAGLSSFDVVREVRIALERALGVKRREAPKVGHGGTLDPFCTGLLVVLVGRGTKLSRFFLGSRKAYTGQMIFGQTTIPGDPTAEISERSEVMPTGIEPLQKLAESFTLHPYEQIPPM